MQNSVNILKKFSFPFHKLHRNLALIIGSYGLFIIIFFSLSTHWLFHATLEPNYQLLLPTAWSPNGAIEHILGTNQLGQDIFDYLLISYRSTLSITIKTTLYAIIAGAIINYLLFFVLVLRSTLMLLLRLLNIIPPLISIITISLFIENSTTTMIVVIGIAHLPRFIYNIHQEIVKEDKKNYISAYRLDGLPPFKLFYQCIIPNIIPAYLAEIVTLFSHTILAITTLNFLGFNNNSSHPNLGIMMFQMKDMLHTNHWAFLLPGFAIIFTITSVYLLHFGLFSQRTRN